MRPVRRLLRSHRPEWVRAASSGARAPPPGPGTVAEALPRSQIREVMELAWAAERSGRRIIHMEVGQPDLPAPPSAVQASQSALNDPVAWRYCPNAGELTSRRAVAAAIQVRTGCAVDHEEVMLSVGTAGAISVAFSAVLDAGDEILIPDPMWPNVDMAARLFKASPVRYRMPAERGFQADLGEIEALITPRTKAIYVCSPSNPTGKLVPADTMDGLLRICIARGLFLVSDEIYGEIVFDGRQEVSCLSVPAMQQAGDHVLWLGGVSKSHAMTGFRTGFLRAPRSLMPVLEKNQEALLSCGVPFAQRGAAAAVGSESRAAVASAAQVYGRRRDLALSALKEAGLPMPPQLVPDGAFYMLVPCGRRGPDVSRDTSTEVALELLEKEGVALAPGGTFGKEAENFLRLSFATADADVLEGTRRLATFLLSRGAAKWWPTFDN